MSTRCNIIIKDRYNERVVLYHHHDRYPEGVGHDLRGFLDKKFKSGYWFPYSFGLANSLIKNKCGMFDEEYEITPSVHTDIEYLYVVNLKCKSVRCYNVEWGEEDLKKIVNRRNLVSIPEFEDGDKFMYQREA